MGDPRVVPFEQWRRGPRGPARVTWPVTDLFVHHSVTAVTLNPLDDARRVEQVGIERFGRLSYSTLFHPTGIIYEGQGDWIGAHTADRNSTSRGLCFIGNYESRVLSQEQIASFRWYRAWLVRTGRLRPVHNVRPHRAVKSTACPGNDIVRRWPSLMASAPTTTAPKPKPTEAAMPLPEVQVDPKTKARTLIFPTGVAYQKPTADEESAFRAVLDLGRDDDVSLTIEVDRYQALYRKAHREALGL